jgi:hypothetical protein
MTNIKTTTWAEDILEANMEGYSEKERFNYLRDVQRAGCISGCVSGAIYTHELATLFAENLDTILPELEMYKDDYEHDVLAGINPIDIPQAAVWFILEQTAAEMFNTLEEPEEEEKPSLFGPWDEE